MGAVTFSSALVACTLVVDTSGLTGGEDTAREDGGHADVSPLDEASTEDALPVEGPDADSRADGGDASCSPPIAEDHFERSVDGGLGTADVGGDWTVGSAQFVSVKAGAATTTVDAGKGIDAYLEGVSVVDADISFVFFVDDTFTGSSGSALYITVLGRRVDASDEYDARVLVRPDGSVDAYLGSIVGGTQNTSTSRTNISDLAFAPNRRFRVRMVVQGRAPTRMKLRLWQDGTPEPSAWTLEGSDETAALQMPGGVGFKIYLSSAATSGPLAITVDDFVVRAPCAP